MPFGTMAASRIHPGVLYLCLHRVCLCSRCWPHRKQNRQRCQPHGHRVASEVFPVLFVTSWGTERRVRAPVEPAVANVGRLMHRCITEAPEKSLQGFTLVQLLLMAHLLGSQLLNHPLVACDAEQQFGYSACCRQFVTISITLHKSPLWKHNTLPSALFCSSSCK